MRRHPLFLRQRQGLFRIDLPLPHVPEGSRQLLRAVRCLRSGGVSWTRGSRKLYRSSNHVSRAFCADCGTPLSYEADGYEPSIAAGAFDDPATLPPVVQYGVEAELPFTAGLSSLKRLRTDEGFEGAEFVNDVISFQHPDHDTPVWPLSKA